MNSKPLKVEPLYWLTIIIIARFSCGALSNIPLFTILFTFIYIICFIVLFCFTKERIAGKAIGMFISLFTYAAEVIYITYTKTNNMFNTQAFNTYVIVALFFIYNWLKEAEREKKRTIISVSIAGYLFTFVYSIVKLYQDPLLSRKKAASIVTENSVDTINGVGGFDTVYGALLIICVLLFLYFYIPKGCHGIMYWAVLFSGIVFLIMATFATSIVLLACILVIWFFSRNKLLASITLVLVTIGIFYHVPIGQSIMEFSETITFSAPMAEKIYEVGYMICNGEMAGTLAGEEGRIARMMWSWDAFLQYPIFGAYAKSGVRIGGHSEIVDTLGRFGLFGFFSIVCFFTFLYFDTREKLRDKRAKLCQNVVYCIFVLTSFLNPSLYMQIVVPLFIIVPYWEDAMGY